VAARMRSRTETPTIADFLADDQRVICIESFRPMQVSSLVERGSYYRLSDTVVRQFPAHFALVIPISDVLLNEIER
jgi:hypothetical protein